MQAKILLIDVETSPSLGYVWGMYEQNVIEFKSQWYIMCFGAKWLGEKTVVKALPDYTLYKKNRENDKDLVKDIWRLMDEADIIIAHNGNKFDFKKINSRFAIHGLPPPSPYKAIDTCLVARRYFGFLSNKLDDLGNELGLGRKVKHSGFEMWKGCMSGNLFSWQEMKKYNKQDVDLLEKVYLHFRGWMHTHPNVSNLLSKTCCPKCGSRNLHSKGFHFTQVGKYRRFQCQDCGGYGRVRLNEQEDNINTNA